MKLWTITAALLISLSTLHAAEAVKPEAEVSASSGPVKLTLQVYKTELFSHKTTVQKTDFARMHKEHPGELPTSFYESPEARKYDYDEQEDEWEPLWIRIGITNVGKKPILVLEHAFTGSKDFLIAIGDALSSQRGIYLDLRDSKGKKVDWISSVSFDGGTIIRPEDYSPEMKASELHHQELVAGWKKAGYSRDKINQLLAELNTREAEQSQEKWEAQHPAKSVNPGETVWTSSYLVQPPYPLHRPEKSAPIGDFAEVPNFNIKKPGIYKIRAVYDESYSSGPSTLFDIRPEYDEETRALMTRFKKEAEREPHIDEKPNDWNVRARTAWIKVEVKP